MKNDVLLHYDLVTGKVIQTASCPPGMTVNPGTDEDGNCWSDGLSYPQEQIRGWRIPARFVEAAGGASVFHKTHKYLFVREEDGKPIGVRAATMQEKWEIDNRRQINESKAKIQELWQQKKELEEMVKNGAPIEAYQADLDAIQRQLNAHYDVLRRKS